MASHEQTVEIERDEDDEAAARMIRINLIAHTIIQAIPGKCQTGEVQAALSCVIGYVIGSVVPPEQREHAIAIVVNAIRAAIEDGDTKLGPVQ